MRKVRTLIGMPVICGHRRIGRVLRAEIDGDIRRLEGVWISGGLRGARFIPAEDLEMLGEVAVIAATPGGRGPAPGPGLFRRAVSTDGARLGAITGAEIDELSFNVVALELCAGLWDDLFARRERVLRYTVNRETGEVIVDPAGDGKEAQGHERQLDQGDARGNADRRIGRDGLRRDELEDGARMEPQGTPDQQLDLRRGG